jgi:hypothetical protein|tara:strand:- start:371 stop:1153 length:783 start_codon:yes stop_codon:yes gene_type:complete
MTNKYALVDLEPNIDTTPGTTHGSSDILFDWTPIEIPTGACSVKTIHAIVEGTDGAAGNTHDIQLYFARSINGVAPPTFGTENAITVKATTLAYRRHLLGFVHLDLSAIDNSDALRSYSVIGGRTASGNDGTANAGEMYNITLQGDPMYASTKGYQTIFIAGYGAGAFNFGTDVTLNQAGHQAADTTGDSVTLTVDGGGDPRNSFAAGDQLIGSTGGPKMEVVSVTSDTEMAVKNITEQIDDDEELVVRNPLKFRIGLEY